MFESNFFNTALIIFMLLSVVVLAYLTLGKLVAPYGKMTSTAWGNIMIPARWGWLIIESPTSTIFVVLLLLCQHLNAGLIVLFVVWQFHYFYRSFIYPFVTNRSKSMPIAVVFSGLSFQLVNTYFQAGWLYIVSPPEMYGKGYLSSWQFILGLIVFLTGTFINRLSDRTLKNLRKPGETEYKIPYGGLYKYISCPNYFGEIIIWLGWAIMLKSLVGLAFFLWTLANLCPRAWASHKWYLQKFPDYPKERKAFIPYML